MAALLKLLTPVIQLGCRHRVAAQFWFKYMAKKEIPLFRLAPPESLAPNARLEGPIRQALLYAPLGVHVLYAPPDHGKSTAARHVIQSMQRSGTLLGCLELGHDLKLGKPSNAVDLVNACLDIRAHVQKVSDLVPEKWRRDPKCVTLLCDQFETIAPRCDELGPRYLENLICGLALDSQASKAYNVLVIVKDEELYNRILKFNGGKKILPVKLDAFRWSREELEEVLKKFEELGALTVDQNGRERILDDATAAGNVGALVGLIGHYNSATKPEGD
mmetsp:Transcript_73057/g.171726  ORF Transcript_73057/g.171726 Transcript_73057/m.171726 type:complete len:275 (-) Transcript_73057:68-892(-)